MNITMTNVVFVDQHGKMRPLDNFFLLARNVKYIHIPEEVQTLFIFRILFENFQSQLFLYFIQMFSISCEWSRIDCWTLCLIVIHGKWVFCGQTFINFYFKFWMSVVWRIPHSIAYLDTIWRSGSIRIENQMQTSLHLAFKLIWGNNTHSNQMMLHKPSLTALKNVLFVCVSTALTQLLLLSHLTYYVIANSQLSMFVHD